MATPAIQAGDERRRVLFVSSDAEATAALRAEISALGDVFAVENAAFVTDAISTLSPCLLVLDLDSLDDNSRAVATSVQALKSGCNGLPILGLTRHHPTANRVRSNGIRTLVGPVDPDELVSAVSEMLTNRRGGSDALAATERQSLGQLIGSSEPMQRVYEAILRLADSNTTVLIRGESGSGKELAARAIVAHGRRSSKPFISLNCAALPESLIEAELFGHERGAFTGADRARPGQIELAHAGTLFLDEIATLTLPLQSKLLRVLEDREVRRIGGNVARNIDFRLITATNEDLEEMTRLGRFREDLYYRINVVPLVMPSLCEREGDIPLLIDHYLKHFCALENVELKQIDLEAVEILEEYNWPGNVRELENLVQRLVLMVPGSRIEARHLPKMVLYATAAQHESLLIPENGIDFEKELQRIEGAYLRAALRRTEGRKAEAGKLLKLSPRQMKYLCQKHGL